MSIRVVRVVLEANIRPPSAKLVAVVLAEHADHDGVSWPGYRLIAEEASVTQMSVSRALRRLRELGVIGVDKGRQHETSTYTLRYNRLLALASSSSNNEDLPALTSRAGSSNIRDMTVPTSFERNRHIEPSSRTGQRNRANIPSEQDWLERRYERGKRGQQPDESEEEVKCECGDDVDYFTPDGEPYCEKHGPGPESLLARAE